MCPVRALDAYVHRTALWRRADQLLVCYGPPKRGHPVSKQTLSRWIVDDITVAYESSDLPPPLGVNAHSTRSVAPPRPFWQVCLCRTSATLRDCLRPSRSSGSMTWIWSHPWLFCSLAIAVLSHTRQGFASLARGHLVPLAFPTQLEFLKGNVPV